MIVNREDVLRELELLPVWKLRTALSSELKPKAPVIEAPIIETQKAETTSAATAPVRYTCTISDDKKWAFIWPASLILSASHSTLFSNILVALKISKTNQTGIESLAHIEASVIIVMGEAAAQALLNSQESIENFRGKLHTLADTSADSNIVITYDLAYLLANPLQKAKAWQDLCLASAHIQSLQT